MITPKIDPEILAGLSKIPYQEPPVQTKEFYDVSVTFGGWEYTEARVKESDDGLTITVNDQINGVGGPIVSSSKAIELTTQEADSIYALLTKWREFHQGKLEQEENLRDATESSKDKEGRFKRAYNHITNIVRDNKVDITELNERLMFSLQCSNNQARTYIRNALSHGIIEIESDMSTICLSEKK